MLMHPSSESVTPAPDAERDNWIGWRPGCGSFLVVFVSFVVIGWLAFSSDPALSGIDRYVAVAWTLPIASSLVGAYGGFRTFAIMRRSPRESAEVPIVPDRLVVVIPTVGRTDVLPALERVISSMVSALPQFFMDVRVDVVIDEGSASQKAIEVLASETPLVRVLVVPRRFETRHGTRFKARANHYAHLRRQADGEANRNVWVLHMDDDTSLGPGAASEFARFVHEQGAAGDAALDLCQGLLCYPREFAPNRFTWLADSIRPGCDIALFSAVTGRGSPLAGLHGEMLLIRASAEASIGWDFGPRSLVEDAEFALRFCELHPGRSGWVAARSYGASPSTITDFIRQRERWVWGLVELVTRKGNGMHISLPHRLLMLHNVSVWLCAPLCHPVVVLSLCLLAGDFQSSPAAPVLIPLWAFNMGFWAWLYWEGLKLNALASSRKGRRWWEPLCLIVLSPLFSLCEVIGIARGLVRYATNSEPKFTVIAKPA